jgi:glucosamine--fructose-6-phosphate aminotransferase (isomerizing)
MSLNPLDVVHELILSVSGIFGYINYLVEKDRKFILDTLVNG